MELKPGLTATLTVARKADFGYFLTDGKTDILLHSRETKGDLEIGSTLEVFLYLDHQNRLSATMETPIVKNDEFAWLEVIQVKKGHGVFLYNGIKRDLFVSMDELPGDEIYWPIRGDKLPVSLDWDKKGRLMGVLVRGLPIERLAEKADPIVLNQDISGTIYHYADEGALIFTDKSYLAFLHDDEMIGTYRIGEKIRARVIYVREDGRINVTTKALRSERQKDDAAKLLEYLEANNGSMPFGDKSSPESIKAAFNISKASFKRALGKLIKEGKIEQRHGWTYLKGQQ
ncbi:CvfB family protein [Alkalicoccobacillus porphyridii]|uniref:S1 motif domain-containing protein n=1 Tax=Alkalicoccobacillus porphyridii TaxID=2597270 RepID=A0A553ZZC5_9BACI|nr:S1-like domain-containing RNA-binding protein [Alkalicoccobacillus porphyridii]TSB46789.1 hypothetical protein FN960_10625 [Alkalicoccobacillus porphyridii]